MEAGKIAGLAFLRTERNPDRRGSLDVVFCEKWPGVPATAQWNVVRSRAGVLRGVHAHSHYDEIYAPLVGRMFIALKDARRSSETFGAAIGAWVDGADGNQAIVVPAGVAHGVFFPTEGILIYGLSTPWTGEREFNCRWNDPALGVAWPEAQPILSDRDAAAGGYAQMVDALNTALDAPN